MSDRERADAVYEELLTRQGEQWVQPRLDRTARVLELLDNPQRTYRVVHVTGTNGKTSTSRMIESLLRAHDLRTGLFTSPHLRRFTERILIDGEPVDDAAIAEAWDEVSAFVTLVDAELEADGQARLTFFEVLTVLAFVAFADAPIDVLVLEVGMGGAWDSTNTADGDVAVFTPIAMDHADRLGDTVEAIASVKAGIIKDGAAVVSAVQTPAVEAVLRRAAEQKQATIAFEGQDFVLESQRLAVGGQLISVRGRAGHYADEYLPQYGEHQAHNAALALAAVESLIGGAATAIAGDIVSQGLQEATSPGRMQLIGTDPTVLVDAGHNPHGAAALVKGLREFFDFDEWGVVFGALADKDVTGILAALEPLNPELFLTTPESPRALDADALADIAEAMGKQVSVYPELSSAADAARGWAMESPRRAVVIVGSVVLAGEALLLAEEESWKPSGADQ